MKPIDGLWHYNSGYSEEYPNYMKKIDAMIKQGRKRKAAHQPSKEQEASNADEAVAAGEPDDKG